MRPGFKALSALAAVVVLAAADRPRVFITESPAAQITGGGTLGEMKGSVAVSGGTSAQNVEVIKIFSRTCSDAIVTSNREKADYVVRLDHEALSPTTPFVHGNKVAVFNKDDDLIYSNSSRLLSTAVNGACTAILDRSSRRH